MELIERDVNTIVESLRPIRFDGHTVLVTGGAGFLGSWMCDALLALGAHVICADDLSSGLRENVAGHADRPGFKFLRHDITMPLPIIDKVDLVLHMASRASPFEFDKFPLEILKTNTLGTLSALELAREHGAKFMFTSTSEAYGDPSVVPTPETYNGNVNTVGARSCYDEAKRCGEAIVMAFRREYGLDTRIARIFNTYGPRIRSDGYYGRVVSRFIAQALKGSPITIFGSGRQTRSFCYVTDEIEGLLRLVASEDTGGLPVNIGGNSEVTVLKLADTIRNLTGSASPLVYRPLPEDDPVRRCPDTARARELLGWHPRVGLESGLARMIQWVTSYSLASSRL